MKSLADIYREEGRPALKRLAEAAGTDPEYLYQIAVSFRGDRASPRRPSPDLARRLMAADSRLTWDSFYSVESDPPAPQDRAA